MTLFWTILIIGFIALEASTTQLICIWFAGGALVSLIFSMFNFGFWVQIVGFIVASFLLLIATKPIVQKMKKRPGLKTNSDALIGKKAIVLEDISNINSKGTVKFNDIEWSARSNDDSEIESGTPVIVREISGVKLIVSKIEEE